METRKFSIVLIEDEPFVLEGLLNLIRWEEHGVRVAGWSTSGSTGLEIIRREKPDIVMTDIRLPGVDGLTVVEETKRLLPNSACIVFSGYSEFHYAKTALSLGVVDYLSKPITVEKIEAVLGKAIETITRKLEFQQMKVSLSRNQRVLLDSLIFRILKGEVLADAFLAEFARNHKFNPVSIRDVVVVVATPESGQSGDQGLGLEEVRETLKLRWKSRSILCFFYREGDQLIAVLVGKKESAESQEVMQAFQELSGSGSADEEPSFAIGIGQRYFHINEIHRSYTEALKALKYGVFLEMPGVFRFRELEYGQTTLPLADSSQETIVFNMRAGNKAKVEQHVKALLQELRSHQLSREVVVHACLQLVYLGLRVTRETGEDLMKSGLMDQPPHILIEQQASFDDLTKWLLRTFSAMMDWLERVRRSKTRKSIVSVQQYLQTNFGEEITLHSLADMAHMNPTYFSMVFKQEVGVCYAKYLKTVRLKHAEALLGEGRKVTEVSRLVGYQHPRYFSGVFKKATGMTPDQFRRNRTKEPAPQGTASEPGLK